MPEINLLPANYGNGRQCRENNDNGAEYATPVLANRTRPMRVTDNAAPLVQTPHRISPFG
jgi:hypothetical protein